MKFDKIDGTYHALLPFLMLFAMGCAVLFVDAVLPLYGLWFHTALLLPRAQWTLLPTHILFPGWQLTPSLFVNYGTAPPSLALSWRETPLLLGAFLIVFALYLVALRILPQRINLFFLLFSVFTLGILYTFVPVVPSQDIFSYIIYARMWAIYHLNPLFLTPMAVIADPVFKHLYWTNQPSAYGPSWILITGLLQSLGDRFSKTNIMSMVLMLRLLGLVAHLWSTLLVWSIGGRLQRLQGTSNPRLCMLATLAFAWNPLLLFEACVNAHNDAVLLLFVLLAIWFLVQNVPVTSYILAAFLLGLATCLKVNIALLIPGLLLFLWAKPRRIQAIGTVLIVYLGTIVVLYAPLWQHGAILSILHINPATYRSTNTLPEFLAHFYNSVVQRLGFPAAPAIGSPAETFFHSLSMLLFAILYSLICVRAILPRHRLQTPHQLLRWMALAWFLYCAVGTPWFWPWYTVTFFGLFALVEAAPIDAQSKGIQNVEKAASFKYLPMAVRVLAFSMLSLYCFYTWGPYNSFIPLLPGFRWAYLRSLWAWLLPLLPLCYWYAHSLAQRRKLHHAHISTAVEQKRQVL